MLCKPFAGQCGSMRSLLFRWTGYTAQQTCRTLLAKQINHLARPYGHETKLSRLILQGGRCIRVLLLPSLASLGAASLRGGGGLLSKFLAETATAHIRALCTYIRLCLASNRSNVTLGIFTVLGSILQQASLRPLQ